MVAGETWSIFLTSKCIFLQHFHPFRLYETAMYTLEVSYWRHTPIVTIYSELNAEDNGRLLRSSALFLAPLFSDLNICSSPCSKTLKTQVRKYKKSYLTLATDIPHKRMPWVLPSAAVSD